jgi:hypothetical protein
VSAKINRRKRRREDRRSANSRIVADTQAGHPGTEGCPAYGNLRLVGAVRKIGFNYYR